MNLVIPNNGVGLYLNVVNGTTFSSLGFLPAAGEPGFNYDLNIYGGQTTSVGFTFWTPQLQGQSSQVPVTSRGYALTPGSIDVANLAPGTLIGSSSAFNVGAAASGVALGTGTPAYFGFRFRDEGADLGSETDDTVHYGFAQVILAPGQPGTLVRYVYESTPLAPITVTASPVPEPATMAILGLGAAALLRRRRSA